MSVIINYTKKDYDAKITELSGYYETLKQHLAKLNSLKSEMFNFWDDPNAQKTGQVLNRTIHNVEFTMTQTNDMLIFYRQCVDKFTGANVSIDEILDKALSVLSETK